MILLLDTNVAINLLLGDRQAISPQTAMLLGSPDNRVLLSACSVWEIAIKRSLGKLELADRWLGELFKLDFDHLPVTAHHAARVEELPFHHRDPFDRLLVAQAQSEGATLVTSDVRLAEYDVSVMQA